MRLQAPVVATHVVAPSDVDGPNLSLRSVHELFWALILIQVLGISPAAGVLALVLAVWQRASLVDVALSSQTPLPHAIILASTAGLVSLLAAFALWGLFL